MRAQRTDMDLFGQGLADMFAGRQSEEAEAASINFASAITTMVNSVTENKWGK